MDGGSSYWPKAGSGSLQLNWDALSVDNAFKFIIRLGCGTHLIKVDLKSAYRVVQIHPQDRHLFNICRDEHVYVDQALPFGLRSAPLLLKAVADAIGWALIRAGMELQILLPKGDNRCWALDFGASTLPGR